MKTAIYIEDGVQQVVLTPENDFEKNILSSLAKDESELTVFEGSFYDCRGGWIRQNDYTEPSDWRTSSSQDKSLIITKRING